MADEINRPNEEGFGIPVVPEHLGIDPVLLALLHLTAVVDFADDDLIDGQVANQALEQVELYLERLRPADVERLQGQVDRLDDFATKEGWPEDVCEFVRDFLYNYGLDDEDGASEDE